MPIIKKQTNRKLPSAIQFFSSLLRQTVRGTRQISINPLIYSQSIPCQPPAAPPFPLLSSREQDADWAELCSRWLQFCGRLTARPDAFFFASKQSIDCRGVRVFKRLSVRGFRAAERNGVINITSQRRRERRSDVAAHSRFMSAASCLAAQPVCFMGFW